MAVKIHEIAISAESDSNVLKVGVSGKLTAEDYELFVPEIVRRIEEHGKIRILFEMQNFHGWTAGALWQDIKFDLKHFRDIDRIAMIGDKAWEHGMATFCKPITSAKIRYFNHDQVDAAQKWIEEK